MTHDHSRHLDRRHLRRGVSDDGRPAHRHRRDAPNGRRPRARSRPATPPPSSAATPRPASNANCRRTETPDGRPGVSLLLFAFSRDSLQKAVVNRVGQCILTCPTTACYNGLPIVQGQSDPRRRQPALLRRRLAIQQEARRPALLAHAGHGRRVHLRGPLRHDQGRGRRQLPDPGRRSSDGAGGGRSGRGGHRPRAGRRSCRSPAASCRSGSKVGSRYKKLRASTNDAYCPTLRGLVKSALPDGGNAVYEIVIDGVDLPPSRRRRASACGRPAGPACSALRAGNYGGKLGPFHLHLHRLLRRAAGAEGSTKAHHADELVGLHRLRLLDPPCGTDRNAHPPLHLHRHSPCRGPASPGPRHHLNDRSNRRPDGAAW